MPTIDSRNGNERHERGASSPDVMASDSAHKRDGVQLFPKSEFGRFPKRLTAQSTLLKERLMSDKEHFEPVHTYRDGSRLREASRPVGILELLYSDGSGACTASLISQDLLLTNAHCTGADVREARFSPEFLDEGRPPVSFSVNTRPVEVDEELDYAILQVSGSPGKTFGVIALSPEAPSPGDDLSIFHHPLGHIKSVTRYGCLAKSVHNGLLGHLCDTLPGSSGAPVFTGDNKHVVAIHHSGSGTARHPLNLATTVAQIAMRSQIVARLIAKPASAPPQTLPRSSPSGTSEPRPAPSVQGIRGERNVEFTFKSTSEMPLRLIVRYRDPHSGTWQLTTWTTLEFGDTRTVTTLGNHVFTFVETVEPGCTWEADSRDPNRHDEQIDGRYLRMARQSSTSPKEITYECRDHS